MRKREGSDFKGGKFLLHKRPLYSNRSFIFFSNITGIQLGMYLEIGIISFYWYYSLEIRTY